MVKKITNDHCYYYGYMSSRLTNDFFKKHDPVTLFYISNISQTNGMTHWVQVLGIQSGRSEFNPWNLHKSERG